MTGSQVDVLVTVLARDGSGAEVADPRRTLRLSGCARLVAALRETPEGGGPGEPHPLDLDGLRDLLRRRGGRPVYGWRFVDLADEPWLREPSLALDLGGPGGHTLTLFQDLRENLLDLRVWFADLVVLDGGGATVPRERFVAEGVAWWDAMYAGAPSRLAPSIAALPPEPRRWWQRFRRTPR